MTAIPDDARPPMVNRRIFLGHAVDAVMSWWLGGFQHEDPETRDALMEWWSTDAPDAALEIVHVVLQAIEEKGCRIIKEAQP